ncbi:hypothetical protein M3Y94_01145500 [Aphelenchoides besseyi]|nr:hypothetical protein M3Y94_01145500 [Aphelenchoides besseyi]KAI6227907.1 hypothetical protein M3Y95_00566200 [Aphelenchoides besseyi]
MNVLLVCLLLTFVLMSCSIAVQTDSQFELNKERDLKIQEIGTLELRAHKRFKRQFFPGAGYGMPFGGFGMPFMNPGMIPQLFTISSQKRSFRGNPWFGGPSWKSSNLFMSFGRR